MRSRLKKLDKKTAIAVGLGQLLSLCITGTSSASSALWNHYAISIPFTQNFCNYLLLASVYFAMPQLFSHRRQSSTIGSSKITWQCKVSQ